VSAISNSLDDNTLRPSREGESARLPYGVGTISRQAMWGALILGAVVVAGVIAFIYHLKEGLVVTGLRDWGTMRGSPWGLYIAFVVYFVGVSFAGITMAALIRLLDVKVLRPIARVAELLTIVSLLLGGMTVLSDLGQPGRGIVNLFKYARPQSPFFGTFTLVLAGYLFASVVYFYLAGRRDAYLMAQYPSRFRKFYELWAAGYRDTPEQRARYARTSLLLSLAIIPLLVTAHSTLGLVFGLMSGRPGWYSTLQAPAFVVLAGVSGIGHIVVIAALLRYALHETEQIGLETFKTLGLYLLVLSIVYAYFTGLEVLTSSYAGHEADWEVTKLLLGGAYAPYFWTAVAALLIAICILGAQAFTGKWSIAWTVVAGVMVNVTAIGKRLIIVTPALTHGSLLPYPKGFYRPSWVEFATIIGLMALGALLILGFVKVFPVMELPGYSNEGEAASGAWLSEETNISEHSPVGGVQVSRSEGQQSEASLAPHETQENLNDKQERISDRQRTAAVVAALMVVVGLVATVGAYFFLAAPWGMPPSSIRYSEPRMPFAPTVVVGGVILVFLAAVVYELWPDKSK
jgi:Ni/Fe-hydrogenase subunit HybB-like protein